MTIQVTLTHDNLLKKWEIHVSGAKDEKEARQAFYAAALTMQMLEPDLLDKAVIEKCPTTRNAYLVQPAGSSTSGTIQTAGQVINEVHAFMPTPNTRDICRLCGRSRETQFHQL